MSGYHAGAGTDDVLVQADDEDVVEVDRDPPGGTRSYSGLLLPAPARHAVDDTAEIIACKLRSRPVTNATKKVKLGYTIVRSKA